jgi:hypothetical protein
MLLATDVSLDASAEGDRRRILVGDTITHSARLTNSRRRSAHAALMRECKNRTCSRNKFAAN